MSINLETGVQFILFLQGLGDWLVVPMQFFSFLGKEEFLILVVPALYWSINPGLGIRVGAILLLADGLNYFLKLAFHSPRPFWYSREVRPLALETSFGAPSGHAQDAAAAWGLAAVKVRRWWAFVAAGLVIFLIGLSRAYLGVHFFSDVVIGWLIGLTGLGVFLSLEAPFISWFKRLKLESRLLAVFGFSLAMIAVGSLIRLSLSDWQLPATWLENAAAAFPAEDAPNPFSLDGLITTQATLFGLAAGAIWLFSQKEYQVSGPLWQRLARYLVGLIGVIVLWLGLGAVFPRGENLMAYSLRYLRYALIGVWITALAPLLFSRLGLVQIESKLRTKKHPRRQRKSAAR
ncbi:MAG TPA: phosphatase PAP2 family protein [Anaerolineales bacterium]|nr:phosphatase PAP2 family protein [Anaerolineales bacterium]